MSFLCKFLGRTQNQIEILKTAINESVGHYQRHQEKDAEEARERASVEIEGRLRKELDAIWMKEVHDGLSAWWAVWTQTWEQKQKIVRTFFALSDLFLFD